MDAHATAADGSHRGRDGSLGSTTHAHERRTTTMATSFSMTTRLTTFLFLFCLWAGALDTVSARPDLVRRSGSELAADQIIALDLIPSATLGGQLEVELGADSATQKVRLLPVFRKKTESVVQVPGVQLCAEFPKERAWNGMRRPRSKEVVVANPGTLSSSTVKQMVRWAPKNGESDLKLGLMLRKGLDGEAKNVTIIEDSLANVGEYLWDVSATYREKKLSEGSDYSLMIFTDSPSRTSYSSYFTISSNSSNPTYSLNVAPGFNSSASTFDGPRQCYGFFSSNGGFYNSSIDTNVVVSPFSQGIFNTELVGREVSNTASVNTQLVFDIPDRNTSLSFLGTPIDVISQSNLGMGTVSVNGLQKSRGPVIDELDLEVVGLYVGTQERPGSVVLGGYDRALIDQTKSAVFAKGPEHPSVIQLPLRNFALVKYVLGYPTTVDVRQRPIFNVALSWDAQGLRLPQDYLDLIIPNIGSPVYDGSVGGYVYPSADAFEDDNLMSYSLLFTFNNVTANLDVSIPISSLVMTEFSDDNPLTPLQESGRKYLALSSTPDGSTAGAYLGRRFLQHVYVIDSPETVSKFHMNVVKQENLQKDLIAATSLGIFDGNIPGKSKNKSSKTGIIIAAVVGAFGVIVACIFLLWLWRRGKRRGSFRVSSADNEAHNYAMAKELGLDKDLEFLSQPAPIAYRPGRSRKERERRSKRRNRSQPSMLTSETIEIRYSPSDKELGLSLPSSSQPVHSPFHYGNPGSHLQPHIWTNHRSRQSEASTVAREVESLSSSPSIPDETSVGFVAAHNPEVSDARLRHRSASGQIFAPHRRSSLSEFFEARSLSPPTPRLPPAALEKGEITADTLGELTTSPLSALSRQLSTASAAAASSISAMTDASLASDGRASSIIIQPTGHTRTASLGKLLTPTTVEIRSPTRSTIPTPPNEDAPPISAVEPTSSSASTVSPINILGLTIPPLSETPAPPSPERSSPIKHNRYTFHGPPEEPTLIMRPETRTSGSRASTRNSGPISAMVWADDGESEKAPTTGSGKVEGKKKIKRSSFNKKLPRIPSPTMYDEPEAYGSRESSIELERPVVGTAEVAVGVGKRKSAGSVLRVEVDQSGEGRGLQMPELQIRTSSSRSTPPPPPAPRRQPTLAHEEVKGHAEKWGRNEDDEDTIPLSPPPRIPAASVGGEDMKRESTGSMSLPLQIPSERNSEDDDGEGSVFGLPAVTRDGEFLRMVGAAIVEVEKGRI